MAQLDQLLHESEGMQDAGRMVLMVSAAYGMLSMLCVLCGGLESCVYALCMAQLLEKLEERKSCSCMLRKDCLCV